jgi:hypothetical protein
LRLISLCDAACPSTSFLMADSRAIRLVNWFSGLEALHECYR